MSWNKKKKQEKGRKEKKKDKEEEEEKEEEEKEEEEKEKEEKEERIIYSKKQGEDTFSGSSDTHWCKCLCSEYVLLPPQRHSAPHTWARDSLQR